MSSLGLPSLSKTAHKNLLSQQIDKINEKKKNNNCDHSHKDLFWMIIDI